MSDSNSKSSPTSAGSISLGISQWPAWIGITILTLGSRLPWSLQQPLGAVLGFLLRTLMPSRKKIAKINIALAFPNLHADAQEKLVREHFRALGISLFEFSRAWWGSIAPLRKNLQIDGLDYLKDAIAQGNGVILVSGHFTTLEVCGRLLCDHVPVAGMYRRYSSKAMEWSVKHGRLRYASAMFAKTELRPCVKYLQQGGVLWYAPDQDPSKGDSVFVDFFGTPANSLASTHQLARLSGAQVICFSHYRTHHGEYRLSLAPALTPYPTKDPLQDTAVVINRIETMVRQAPDQYLWIHRRFKRQPDGRNVYKDI